MNMITNLTSERKQKVGQRNRPQIQLVQQSESPALENTSADNVGFRFVRPAMSE